MCVYGRQGTELSAPLYPKQVATHRYHYGEKYFETRKNINIIIIQLMSVESELSVNVHVLYCYAFGRWIQDNSHVSCMVFIDLRSALWHTVFFHRCPLNKNAELRHPCTLLTRMCRDLYQA